MLRHLPSLFSPRPHSPYCSGERSDQAAKMNSSLQRTPLHELSNDHSVFTPASPTLSSPLVQQTRKRKRITDQENQERLLKAFDKPQDELSSSEEDDEEVQEILPRKQHASTFTRLHAATLTTRRLPFHRRESLQPIQHFQSSHFFSANILASAAPVLQSLVSSHHSDVFRIHSTLSQHTFDLPVYCAFSNGSKEGSGSYLLAVSTEEGRVEIMDTRRRAAMDAGRS